MKNLIAIMSVLGLIGLFGVGIADAQLFPYSTTSTVPSSTVVGTTTATTSTASSSSGNVAPTIVSSTRPAATGTTAQPHLLSGYVQFNKMTIRGVSGTAAPAEIMASSTSSSSCRRFQTKNSTRGSTVSCPTGMGYRIEITSSTRLLAPTRARATLSEFMPGDAINVYGYFNEASGTITAKIVRNISRQRLYSAPEASMPLSTSSIEAEIGRLQAELSQIASLIYGNPGSPSSTVLHALPVIDATSTSSSTNPGSPNIY